MTKGGRLDRSAPSSASASGQNTPSGKQLGQVRRSLTKSKWSARFRFQRQGESSSFHGPVRARQDDAETDRKFVAAAMGRVSRSLRMDAALRAIKILREGGEVKSVEAPGSASTAHEVDPQILRSMTSLQLRDVVSRTHGISRNKKTSQGKWVPKTSKELKSELLALTAPRSTVSSAPRFASMEKVIAWTIEKRPVSTHALRGRHASRKHRASSLARRPTATKRTNRHRQAHRPRHCQALPVAPRRLTPCVDPWQRSLVHRICAVPLRIYTRASAQTECDLSALI